VWQQQVNVIGHQAAGECFGERAHERRPEMVSFSVTGVQPTAGMGNKVESRHAEPCLKSCARPAPSGNRLKSSMIINFGARA
jgi:hypothetical protein